jgi:SAM-dependent methyltransferase
MNRWRIQYRLSFVVACIILVTSTAWAQSDKPFEPQVGQAGKDVVWVPTPAALVEKMLDMAKVTPQDVVIDLGSGDGRNVIAAAKRGARARGVEYNPEMVKLSRGIAEKEGVAGRAVFVEGDMFAADISDATVLALFLLPDNLSRLRDTFLNLRPGTRIVMNTFGIPDWEADQTERIESDCSAWCTSLLYFVPAKVAGKWQLDKRELTIAQNFQRISGTLTAGGNSQPIEGKLEGDRVSFSAGGVTYTGRVNGNVMEGTIGSASWRATRIP